MASPQPDPAEDRDGLDCVHLGVDTQRSVQCGKCPGSRTGVWTCDLLAEYCLPVARRPSQQTAGYVVCRACSGFSAATAAAADGR